MTEKEEPQVSIIIPCKTIDIHTQNCINHCLKMEYSNYEIIVLPDDHKSETSGRLRIIPTGPAKPMSKRLAALYATNGALCAFIDSDAYPAENWLKRAICHFKDSDVVAVAGPSLTPNEDDPMAKASGLVLASYLGGGMSSIRYNQSRLHLKYVTEMPACNLIIRHSVLNEIKDRIIDVWPGEEIVLCGIMTKDLKKKIVYDSRVVVYHHRRRLFIAHLKQMWKYGLIKGFLLKSHHKYVRPWFIAPSVLVLVITVGLFLAMINPLMQLLYLITVSSYVLLLFLNGIVIGVQQKSAKIVFLVFAGTLATHMCYGLAFIKGLLTRKLNWQEKCEF